MSELEKSNYVVFRGHDGWAVQLDNGRAVVHLTGVFTRTEAEKKAAELFGEKE